MCVILIALPLASAAGSLAWNRSCSELLCSLSGPPSNVVSSFSSQSTSRPVSGRISIADVAEVFDHVERHRLSFEVLDLVLHDDVVVEQVAGDMVHMFLSIVRLTTMSWATPR